MSSTLLQCTFLTHTTMCSVSLPPSLSPLPYLVSVTFFSFQRSFGLGLNQRAGDVMEVMAKSGQTWLVLLGNPFFCILICFVTDRFTHIALIIGIPD